MSVDVKRILKESGSLLSGDFFFALKSGRVSTAYVNMDPTYTRPRAVELLGSLLISPFADSCKAIAVPATGGIALLYACANEMRIQAPHRETRTVWADKEGDHFGLTRAGFEDAINGNYVAVVDDICTTGGSVKPVCELVRACGGKVVGASVIWNRSGLTAKSLGVPRLHCLIDERLPSWEAGEHEMWGTWPLVENIGHPENFPEYKDRIVL